MNDRFRFRAKRLDNNKFVYGYLCFIYIDNEKHCRIYSPDDVKSYDCYTKTLGQSTGLKDASGNLIYEGDMLLLDPDDPPALVVWNEDVAMFCLVQEDVCYTFDNCGYLPQEMEIVGNSHENPELLEDK